MSCQCRRSLQPRLFRRRPAALAARESFGDRFQPVRPGDVSTSAIFAPKPSGFNWVTGKSTYSANYAMLHQRGHTGCLYAARASKWCGRRDLNPHGLRPTNFHTTSAFAAAPRRSWSGLSLHPSNRLRCRPSSLYTFHPGGWLGSGLAGHRPQLSPNLSGSTSGDFPRRTQVSKSVVSTDSTTSALLVD